MRLLSVQHQPSSRALSTLVSSLPDLVLQAGMANLKIELFSSSELSHTPSRFARLTCVPSSTLPQPCRKRPRATPTSRQSCCTSSCSLIKSSCWPPIAPMRTPSPHLFRATASHGLPPAAAAADSSSPLAPLATHATAHSSSHHHRLLYTTPLQTLSVHCCGWCNIPPSVQAC